MGRRDGVRTRFSALRRPAWRRLIGELDFHDSITRGRRRASCRPTRAACGRVIATCVARVVQSRSAVQLDIRNK